MKRRVCVPSAAVSSCPPSSPVGRCERREQRERCEDARRWNNEFIAACHPHLLNGCSGVFLKLLRRFKSLPASFFPAFLALGGKFLPQVFPLCTPVRSDLADRATNSTSQSFSASHASPTHRVPFASSPPSRHPVSSLPILQPLSALTLARFGLRVTNFSRPPAER